MITAQIDDAFWDEAVRRIRSVAEPDTVLLFGSRVRGEGRRPATSTCSSWSRAVCRATSARFPSTRR